MTNTTSDPEKAPRELKRRTRSGTSSAVDTDNAKVVLCWPFPAGSQNDTDKAVKLPPYVPPKRRTLNQY
jgi:hypothetical protein